MLSYKFTQSGTLIHGGRLYQAWLQPWIGQHAEHEVELNKSPSFGSSDDV